MTQPIIIENPNPRDHLRTEWLLTNGLGGYAMGTVLGINTRRYHGLLVAATNPPVGRIVALHSMIEELIIPREDGTEEVIDLSTQMFVGPPPEGEPMRHPEGWRWLKQFSCDYREVEWRFAVGPVGIIKRLRVGCDSNNVQCEYSSNQDCLLRIRPLLGLRDFHGLKVRAIEDEMKAESEGQHVNGIDHEEVVIKSGKTRIRLGAYYKLAIWRSEPQQWAGFTYIEDRIRGQDYIETVWSPGAFDLEITTEPVACALVSMKLEQPEVSTPWDYEEAPLHVPWSERKSLGGAARQYVVTRFDHTRRVTSIIAGYPWFSDWGRDAMISLPGLLLCTKRFEEAKSLLLLFASHLRNGLIPNHFDDTTGEPRYNTVDASLWFIYAVWQYWKATNPLAPGSAGGSNDNQRRSHNDRRAKPGAKGVDPVLLSACRDIIHAYRTGTDFNIFMDPTDGLISAGNETTQLTWMDAARDGVIFTPRHGKPVEVNALWFNALHFVADMTDDPDEARALRELASTVGASFRAKFWNQEREYLNDVLVSQIPRIAIRGRQEDPVDAIVDSKLRPNQIFAVSLPFSPLSREQQRAVVNTMRDRLLTPYGLRTLDRDDRDYRGRFEGNLFERDRAYHNGTAWPWLLGPYCEAVLHLNDFSDDSKREVREILQPLLDELSRTSGPGCLGQLAEVYDGDPPQRPGGCVAQAWSVAEVLRILTLIGDPPPTVASS